MFETDTKTKREWQKHRETAQKQKFRHLFEFREGIIGIAIKVGNLTAFQMYRRRTINFTPVFSLRSVRFYLITSPSSWRDLPSPRRRSHAFLPLSQDRIDISTLFSLHSLSSSRVKP